MSEEEEKPKLRYKSGIARDSGYTPPDPEEMGFGDLVNDGSKTKLESTRESLSKSAKVANKGLLKISKKLKKSAKEVDYSKIKTSIGKAAKKVADKALEEEKEAKNSQLHYRRSRFPDRLGDVYATQDKPAQRKGGAASNSKNKKEKGSSASIDFSKILSAVKGLFGRVNKRAFAAVALIAMVVIPAYSFMSSRDNGSGPEVSGAVDVVQVDGEGITFETAFPKTLNEEITPFTDEARGITSYETTNQLGNFIVTQQALPEEFVGQPGNLKNLALSLSEKQTINRFDTDHGQVHIVEALDGSQTGVMAIDDKLVFITAPTPVSFENWTLFINSFE